MVGVFQDFKFTNVEQSYSYSFPYSWSGGYVIIYATWSSTNLHDKGSINSILSIFSFNPEVINSFNKRTDLVDCQNIPNPNRVVELYFVG